MKKKFLNLHSIRESKDRAKYKKVLTRIFAKFEDPSNLVKFVMSEPDYICFAEDFVELNLHTKRVSDYKSQFTNKLYDARAEAYERSWDNSECFCEKNYRGG